jgi:hypothetical protein
MSASGARFDARLGDATDPGATIPKESLKGVILSNELPDCFSVHKVILSMNGSAEIAYTVPSVPVDNWKKVESDHPAGRAADHRRRTIRPSARSCSAVRNPERPRLPEQGRIFRHPRRLQRVVQLRSEGESAPVPGSVRAGSVIPELAEHLRQYAHAYAYALSKSGKGMVTYINLGEGKFIKGAGAALKAGYVITIDYGSNWDGILAQDFDHLRMYGQGSSTVASQSVSRPHSQRHDHRRQLQPSGGRRQDGGARSALLRTAALAAMGTPIELEKAPAVRTLTPDDEAEFQQWAGLFYSWEVYKILVQRKEKTDPAYQYSSQFGETSDGGGRQVESGGTRKWRSSKRSWAARRRACFSLPRQAKLALLSPRGIDLPGAGLVLDLVPLLSMRWPIVPRISI